MYSIDECFLYYGKEAAPPQEGWASLATQIRKTVWREVRLPICVSIGPTPTLAKVANHAAKKIEAFKGVAVLGTAAIRRDVLSKMKVTEVWGIGKRLGLRLNTLGINTAWQLANRDPSKIRKEFSIIVEKIVRELNGEVRHTWDSVRAAKKEIYSTRSFGNRITEFNELRSPLASHAETVAIKLRKQKSLAASMTLFSTSSPHDTEGYFRRSHFHRFTVPTNDTRHIVKVIESAMVQLYQSGVRYYKCGVGYWTCTMRDCFSTTCLVHQMTTANLWRVWIILTLNTDVPQFKWPPKASSKSLLCDESSYLLNTRQSGVISLK